MTHDLDVNHTKVILFVKLLKEGYNIRKCGVDRKPYTITKQVRESKIHSISNPCFENLTIHTATMFPAIARQNNFPEKWKICEQSRGGNLAIVN